MSYQQQLASPANLQQNAQRQAGDNSAANNAHLTTGTALEEIAASIDPLVQLDDELKEVLLDACDAFVDLLIDKSTDIAAERGGQHLTADDVNMVLEREMGIVLGGMGQEPARGIQRPPPTEAYQQTMATVKKTLKKP